MFTTHRLVKCNSRSEDATRDYECLFIVKRLDSLRIKAWHA